MATVQSLLERFDVDMLIRLHVEDFTMLRMISGDFVHFNLETTLNEVGHRCAVVPIVTAGRRLADGSEVLPVIDPVQSRSGICVKVLQRVALNEVPATLFRYSLPNIKSVEELRAALVQRYAQMFPALSESELLGRGCAITKLRLDE